MKKKMKCIEHNKNIVEHCASCHKSMCYWCKSTVIAHTGETLCRECYPDTLTAEQRESMNDGGGSIGIILILPGLMGLILLLSVYVFLN